MRAGSGLARRLWRSLRSWRPSPGGVRSHLTECVHQLVLESQLPHKTVNLLLTITNQDDNLTVLWGIRRSKTI